jgi:hypothetical protein
MFSNQFKNKIIKKYNISESIINRPIHYRVPDIVNYKFKDDKRYFTLKRLIYSKSIEGHKEYDLSPIEKNKNVNNHNNQIFTKSLKLLLNNNNLAKSSNLKSFDRRVKMIYEINKLPNIDNKIIMKNIVTKKKGKFSSISPKSYFKLKNQNIPKINDKISCNFFTPELTKIKIKNQNQKGLINLINNPIKNIYSQKELLKNNQSLDYNKLTIRVIKNNKSNDLSNNSNNEEDGNNITKNSFYNHPIKSIKSRYNLTFNDINGGYKN